MRERLLTGAFALAFMILGSLISFTGRSIWGHFTSQGDTVASIQPKLDRIQWSLQNLSDKVDKLPSRDKYDADTKAMTDWLGRLQLEADSNRAGMLANHDQILELKRDKTSFIFPRPPKPGPVPTVWDARYVIFNKYSKANALRLTRGGA